MHSRRKLCILILLPYLDIASLTPPMGMESGVIEDHQLSASTSQFFHDATQSRLGVGASWMFEYGDLDPWICVEFERMADIKGIVIVGKVSI